MHTTRSRRRYYRRRARWVDPLDRELRLYALLLVASVVVLVVVALLRLI